jgi:hypothetical protein
MGCRFALGLGLFVLALCIPSTLAEAANKVWTTGVDGDFGDPAMWTGGVPGATDSATFNVPGAYIVTFDNDPNPLSNPVQNQDLNISVGSVTFVSGLDGTYTYHLTGAGGDDVNLTSGMLILGTIGSPLHLTADDDIVIRGNGIMLVNAGSVVNAADLVMGTVASGGNGTVTVDGSDGISTFNVSGDVVLGQNGSDAILTYRDGAQGNLAALGTVRVGVDSGTFSGTQGILSVENGADLVVGNVSIAAGTSSATGTVTVSGTGSTVTHSGSSALTIGNANPSFSGGGTLNVQFGSTYTVDTGTTTIRGQGLLQLDGGVFTTSGSVHVNDTGDPGMNGRIDLNSQGQFMQIGSADIVLGGASGGASLISLDSSSALFTTGTGLLTINKTGTLDINGGTFNANGDVLVNGGLFDRNSGATFNLAPGKEMTIQNGGRMIFGGSYTAPASTVTNIVGSSSRLESSGGTVTINNGAEIHVSSGGTILNSSVSVGAAGLGVLTVDGLGSSVQGGFGSHNWGQFGGIADVTFSNNAQGSFSSSLSLAQSSQPGTTAIVNVESGADLTLGGLSLATSGGTTTSATLNIRDAGSTVTSSSGVTIGHSSTGVAVINLVDGGTLTMGTGTSTTLNATGRINIDGGVADLKTLNQNGGKINLNSGSLSYLGHLTVGLNGLLGTNLTLGPQTSLSLSGTATVNPGSLLLVVDGGSLTATTINNSGELRIDGLSATLSASSIGNSGTLRGNGRITANVNNAAAGDIRVGAGQQLRFSGGTTFSNSGDIVVLGSAGNPAEFIVNGVASNASATGLIVGRDAILQFDAGLNNNGSLALNLGTNDVFGDINNNGNIVVTGGANATFYDDVTQNGSLTVSQVGSTTSVAVFFGDFTGSGGSSGGGDIFFEGDLRPGASPAEVTYENNVYFGGGANLAIDIGGLIAGTEHDKVNVDGLLELDGNLTLSLIDDFNPQAGDSFDILDWTSLQGSFDNITVPYIGSTLAWDVSQIYLSGEISVMAVPPLPGDFNFDGVVDAADYVVWRKTNSGDPLSYEEWSNNFNPTPAGAGGSTAGVAAEAGVPEPASAILLLCALVALGLTFRR